MKSSPHNSATSTTPSRGAGMGLKLCALVLLLGGLVFLVTGILFAIAPEALRDAGFRQDGTPAIRAGGLLMFGGVGVLLTWTAWKLMRLASFAREITRDLALATAVLSVTRLADDANSVYDWLGLLWTVAIAGYLSLPSVRALFRTPRD